ncbi:hypothetical protein E0493_18570 [Roseomonas sp. M0104]|uniref:Uncharacterized protein n=1 Tax=Teichococcus coralli TaxID=2545983 RepID=A0A845BGV3_9PROT|nr:hypothetical protein [Pseudoroseomonas coralli]MXP65356.1 hypothetical protein [Pseudoroseomonas coralli]
MSASFLRRIAIRAGVLPSAAPSLAAKGLGGAPAMRTELPEEDEAPEDQRLDQRVAQRLARAPAPPSAEAPPEAEEKAPVQRLPARRLSTDPDAEKERAEDAELGPVIHRAAPEPPQPRDEEPTRRAAEPDPATLRPEDEQVPDALAHEPPPRNLRALRRAVAPPAPAASPSALTALPPAGAGATMPAGSGPFAAPEAGPSTGDPPFAAGPALPPPMENSSLPQAPAAERPSVFIEQVEVMIHEPAAPARAATGTDRHRLIRARYLGRL